MNINIEYKVPQSAVKDAKEDQVRQVEINKLACEESMVQEVNTSLQQEQLSQGVKSSIITTPVMSCRNENDSKSKEDLIASEAIMKKFNEIVTKLSIDDYAEMNEEGMTLEKYTASQLDRAIERVKEDRVFRQEHLEKQMVKQEEEREDVEKMAVRNAINSSDKTIVNQLKQSNLPITKQNISKLDQAVGLAEVATQLSDGSMAHMIRQDMEITPENIYKSSYHGGSYNRSAYTQDYVPYGQNISSEGTWELVAQDVEKLLVENSIVSKEEEIGQELLDQTKWLFSHELDITAENLEKLEYLTQLKNEKVSVIDLLSAGMESGKEPKNVNLMKQRITDELVQKARWISEEVQNITEEGLEAVVNSGLEVTLQNLILHNGTNINQSSLRYEHNNITAKRQLEEVRAKLTMENAYRLYQQGIEVDTIALNEVVEQLKVQEQQYYEELMRDQGIESQSSMLEVLQCNNEVTSSLKTMPSIILGDTVARKDVITLQEIYSSGEKRSTLSSQEVNQYETLMTQPRRDMGDSITKAFRNVDDIIEDLNLEVTMANQKAVRILAYNEMEITQESLVQMKEYQNKVDQLLQQLTPENTLQLIHEGVNPIEMPIEQLTEYLNKYESHYELTEDQKFSEFLYALDKKNAITEDERESYIGVYRLLHQINKHDQAAIGAVVQSGKELTLKNLLTAVRSRKESGMDLRVDDTSDRKESPGYSNSITKQIERGFTGKQYYESVLEVLKNELSSSNGVNALSQLTIEEIYDSSLESLYEKMENSSKEITANSIEDNYSDKVSDLQQILHKSYETVPLLVEYGIPVTLENLKAFQIIRNEKNGIYEEMVTSIHTIDEEAAGNIISEIAKMEEVLGTEKIFDVYNEIESISKDVLNRAMMSSVGGEEAFHKLSQVTKTISFAGMLSQKNMHHIPMIIGEEILNLNVQVVEKNDEISTLSIQVPNENAGMFQATFFLDNQGISGVIHCEHREFTSLLENMKCDIVKEMEAQNLKVNSLSITTHNKKYEPWKNQPQNSNSVERETKNRVVKLYEVAKMVIAKYKQAEIQMRDVL